MPTKATARLPGSGAVTEANGVSRKPNPSPFRLPLPPTICLLSLPLSAPSAVQPQRLGASRRDQLSWRGHPPFRRRSPWLPV
jgi:hypothetical protein